MSKEKLMEMLLNLYQTQSTITVPATKVLIDNHIKKLEIELIKKLEG